MLLVSRICAVMLIETKASCMLQSHVIVLLLLVAFPIWDMWEARRLRTHPRSGARIASYLRIILVLWAVTFLIVLNYPLAELLVTPHNQPFRLPTAAVNAITIGVLAVLVLPIGAAVVHPPTQERLRMAASEMSYLLPRGHAEMLLFAVVAVSAGICEELIYRSFLFRYLLAAPFNLSPLWSLIVAAIFFGFGHAGQGPRGALITGASGLFFGWLYLASGSLVLPIVLHSLVDLRVLAVAQISRVHSSQPLR